MTAPSSHERFAELAAGYALHALEPDDEAVFRTHLAGCAECQRGLAEHAETLSHLAYAAAPAELPPALLEGIRREIAAESAAEAQEPSAPAAASLEAARERHHRRLPAGRSLLAAAAAVALVLSLGIWNLALSRDKSHADNRVQQFAAAVQALEQRADHRVPLTDGNGQLVGVALVTGSDVSMVVNGLSPNERATSTYVLWQKGARGDVHPVGAFDVRGAGVDVYRGMRLPAAGDLAGFAVTREAGRTAPVTPGGKPVAAGAVSA